MSFLKKAFEFLSHPSNSRTMGLVVVLLLVTAVSLTVYVAQQQQQIKQKASAVCDDTSIQDCSVMGFDPSSGNNTCTLPYKSLKCRKNNTIYQCGE